MTTHQEEGLYPLRFSPLPKDKVWGGLRLAQTFFPELSTERLIGEAWCVWDQLPIANGALRGKTLAEVVRMHPRSVLGSKPDVRDNSVFPLLIKLLDAQQNLSVQVHPDDDYAQEHEGEPFGKTEVWYILDTEAPAELIRGLQKPMTRSAARQAIEEGTLQEWLDYVPVRKGDVIYNPPGTVHALGAGLLLYELQQSSDLTYRMYDWDRGDPNRPLHIEKSLDVAHLEPYAGHKIQPITLQESEANRTILCACDYFAAELVQVKTEVMERPGGHSFHALTVLQGFGAIHTDATRAEKLSLHAGESIVIPASAQEYQILADGELTLIKAYVPDLLHDVVRPLREKGVPDDLIGQLGGVTGQSDLGRHLR